MTLHFITDAPGYVVRSVMSLASGWSEDVAALVADLARDGLDEPSFPRWAEHIVHVRDTDAMAVLSALRDYRVERQAPARQAIGDPTFAMAAAAIERGSNGSPSSASFASR